MQHQRAHRGARARADNGARSRARMPALDSGNAMHWLRTFFRLEAAGGILLVAAGALALAIANSPLSGLYARALELRIVVSIDRLSLDKPLLLWINDGLMALFFFHIGLAVKREILEGELRTPAQFLLPLL